ncbi:hypothetical protein HKD37_01G001042 [Glycine soja]
MVCTKKTGQMTSKAAKEIAEKICHHQAILQIGSMKLPQFLLKQLTQQIRDQLEELITKKGLALPLEPEVGPSATRVSTKGSCVDPSGNDPEIGDSDKCGLYIEENPSRLVALGRVYEGSTMVHNISLLHG